MQEASFRSPSRRRAAGVVLAVAVAGALSVLLTGRIDVAPPDAAPTDPDAELLRHNGQGRWTRVDTEGSDGRLSAEQRDMIARLEAIGYAAGVEAAGQPGGVRVHDPARAYAGHALYVSGHAPEANLIAPDGRLLHRWRFAMEDAWPDYEAETQNHRARFYFRRAHVFDNGDLLAIFEGYGIIKIDSHSRLLWARRNRAHHDLDVLPSGDIYVLTRTAHLVPEVDPELPKLEDFIVGLRPDGSEFFRLSLIDALRRSDYADFVTRPDERILPIKFTEIRQGDLFHTNAIEIVGKDYPGLPWLRAGNAVVSSRFLSAILVVDLVAGRVVWFHKGAFVGQHEPSVLADGNLLLFDNGVEGRSRAIEIDPRSGAIVWEYPAPSEPGFYTKCCGTVARLPNGNSQLVVTDPAFALEVTPDGEVVWEFRSPHRSGEDDTLVAALFDVVRLPVDFHTGWAGTAP